MNNKIWYDLYSQVEVNLLKRAYLELEDGSFDVANEAAEKCLSINVENEEAWWLKALAANKVKSEEAIAKLSKGDYFKLVGDNSFKKVMKFAGVESKKYYYSLLDPVREKFMQADKEIKDADEAYQTYLKEQLTKMSLGERILEKEKKGQNAITPFGKVIHTIIYLIATLVALYFITIFLQEKMLESATGPDELFDFLYYSLGAVLTFFAASLAYSTVTSLFAFALTKKLTPKEKGNAILTKKQYLNDQTNTSNTLNELFEIKSYIQKTGKPQDFYR